MLQPHTPSYSRSKPRKMLDDQLNHLAVRSNSELPISTGCFAQVCNVLSWNSNAEFSWYNLWAASSRSYSYFATIPFYREYDGLGHDLIIFPRILKRAHLSIVGKMLSHNQSNLVYPQAISFAAILKITLFFLRFGFNYHGANEKDCRLFGRWAVCSIGQLQAT